MTSSSCDVEAAFLRMLSRMATKVNSISANFDIL